MKAELSDSRMDEIGEMIDQVAIFQPGSLTFMTQDRWVFDKSRKDTLKQTILILKEEWELMAVFNELDVLSEMQRISKKTTFSYLTKDGESYIRKRIKELKAQLGGKE